MRQSVKQSLASLLALTLLLGILGGCSSSVSSSSSSEAAGASVAVSSSEASSSEAASSSESVSSQAEEVDGVLELEGPMQLEYAENFSIDLYKGGYRMITAGSNKVRYLTVPEGKSVPEGLDTDVVVLQLPLDSVYMSSTGMVSLIDAIDALDNVKLVGTDVSGWYLDNVIQRMNSGDITYSGKYSEPDYELMTKNEIKLHVDTTMIDNNPEVLEKFQELGIPSLVENSSKEGTPLGRVEWVKLFGVLFDKEEEAQQYFDTQKALVESMPTESSGKTVAMGYITSTGKCYARNGGDYMAQMIGLAGGEYILADVKPEESGNSNMTFEEWYAANKDADCLFYINMANKFYTIQEMIDYNPLFGDFKAVKEGNVWVTSPDFTQSTAAIASIISDMNTVLFSEDPDATTSHLIRIS